MAKHLNVEIKASCEDPDYVREVLHSHEARFLGTDIQVDTYFIVPNGRLKLREGKIENALIFYERDDMAGPRRSEVNMYQTQKGSNLKEVLSSAIGVKTAVEKRREIYFIDNIKFHIDDVKHLGDFVEIEAIDHTGAIGEETLYQQCRHFMSLFKIKEESLLDKSYSDLMLEYQQ